MTMKPHNFSLYVAVSMLVISALSTEASWCDSANSTDLGEKFKSYEILSFCQIIDSYLTSFEKKLNDDYDIVKQNITSRVEEFDKKFPIMVQKSEEHEHDESTGEYVDDSWSQVLEYQNYYLDYYIYLTGSFGTPGFGTINDRFYALADRISLVDSKLIQESGVKQIRNLVLLIIIVKCIVT